MPGAGEHAAADDASTPPRSWFVAEGIPITPYDDAGREEPLSDDAARRRATPAAPMLATTDIVLPVSDEMDCRACHASGAGTPARAARRRAG